MGVSVFQNWLYNSFFEARFHAYVEMSYYFAFYVLVDLALGLWAFFWINNQATTAPNQSCSHLNTFLCLAGILCFAEAILSGWISLTIGNIMRNKSCAVLGVSGLSLYTLAMLAKAGTLTMGALWVYNQPLSHCQTDVPRLYQKTATYLIVLASVYAFQLFCGTTLLISCGLGQAVHEGVVRIKERSLEERYGEDGTQDDDYAYNEDEENPTVESKLLGDNADSRD